MSTELLNKKYRKNIITPEALGNIKRTKLKLCPSLDAAMDGGLLSGQIIEISGPPKIGKTTLALTWGQKAIEQGYKILYIDVEQRLRKEMLDMLNINQQNITVIRSVEDSILTGEDYLEIILDAIRSFEPTFFIIDSVPAMIFDNKVGGSSKPLTNTIRMMNPIVEIKNHFVIWLNHEKIFIDPTSRSKKTYTPGGVHLQYQSSTLIQLIYTKLLRDNTGKAQIGHEFAVNIKSAPTSSPSVAYLQLLYNHGIDIEHDIFMFATSLGIIKVAGSWVTWDDIKAQGQIKFIKEVQNNNKWDELVQLCYNELET